MTSAPRLGLMSVTFRQLSIDQVVAAATQGSLSLLSWTGDAHVPPGDADAAAHARHACADAGIEIEGYGSYWRADGEDVAPWIQAAVALGAPRMRIWAGSTGSAETEPAERVDITERIAVAAEHAATFGVALTLEFHRNTLTDTPESTVALIADIARLRPEGAPPVLSYWQPRPGIEPEEAVAELAMLSNHLDGVHVFSWDADSTRYPLTRNAELWDRVLQVLPERGAPHHLLLEFVKDDAVDQLVADATTLRFLAGLGG